MNQLDTVRALQMSAWSVPPEDICPGQELLCQPLCPVWGVSFMEELQPSPSPQDSQNRGGIRPSTTLPYESHLDIGV